MFSADNLCKQFGPRSGPTKKVNFEKKSAGAKNSMKNYPACKELKKGLTHVRLVRLDDEQLNALVRLHSWSGSHAPSLVTHAIST